MGQSLEGAYSACLYDEKREEERREGYDEKRAVERGFTCCIQFLLVFFLSESYALTHHVFQFLVTFVQFASLEGC